jgi:hypothetical protein
MTTDAKTFPLQQSFPEEARSQLVRRDTQETWLWPPKLADRWREALRLHHFIWRTEQAYYLWAKRFIYFHNIRHPTELEINALLTHFAVRENVSASIQNQALAASLFLYRHVIGRKVNELGCSIGHCFVQASDGLGAVRWYRNAVAGIVGMHRW